MKDPNPNGPIYSQSLQPCFFFALKHPYAKKINLHNPFIQISCKLYFVDSTVDIPDKGKILLSNL